MFIAGLILAGAALGAFLILVAGIRRTDRSYGLRDPASDSRAEAFARRVLGVYADRPRSENAAADQGHEEVNQ